MSKKNKRKFNRPSGPVSSPASTAIGSATMSSSVSSTGSSAGAMAPSAPSAPRGAISTADAHAGEYRIIRGDLLKVLALNVFFLAAILTLYYTNLHSQYVDRWFGHILHF